MHRCVFLFALLMVNMAVDAQEEPFPYPTLPQELKTPQERGTYLLAHYWDNFNFNDTTLIHKPELTEQGFANFIDLLPRIDSTAAEQGVEAFVWRAFGAAVPQNVRNHFSKLTEHYLYDPNSPMRSDELYILFLRRMAVSPAFTSTERERFSYQLTNVSKNLPGTIATDFSYIDRKGQRTTLHQTKGELIMLYFNDPDCDNCHAITAMLSRDSLLTANPHLNVLAVYPDSDTDLWRSNPQPFPSSWTDAYSPDGEISAKQLYFIRATPTVYLLDQDKRIILKDPSLEMLQRCLEDLINNR